MGSKGSPGVLRTSPFGPSHPCDSRGTLADVRGRGALGRLVAVAVTGGVVLSLTSACSRGSDPAMFHRDFRAAVEAHRDQSEKVRAEASEALGGDRATVLAVFEEMLDASREALGSYERLRAPPDHSRALRALILHARAEVVALEHVVDAAEAGRQEPLATALRELATAMSDHKASQTRLFAALRSPEARADR